MSNLFSLLFPERCVNCNKYTENKDHPYVCEKCFSSLPIKPPPSCISCSRQISDNAFCPLCKASYTIDAIISATDYQNTVVENIIHKFKYQFIQDISISLALLVKKSLKERARSQKSSLFKASTLITPVPLDPRRLNWRGFNQAEVLGKLIANTYLVSFDPDILSKKITITHQAEIKDRESRFKNMEKIFYIKDNKKIPGKDIILIDDIVTTGATMNECAKILKENGARSVIGLSIARGQIK